MGNGGAFGIRQNKYFGLHCHAIKNNNSKTIQCKLLKSRTFPTVRSVRFPKLQIFGNIFCTNLQNPIWSPPRWCAGQGGRGGGGEGVGVGMCRWDPGTFSLYQS